jgi:hypothetical protein
VDDGDAGSLSYKLYANEGAEGTVFHQVTAYDGSSLTYDVNVAAAIGSSGKTFTLGKIYSFKFTAVNEVGESTARYPANVTKIAMARVPV